MFWPWKKKPYPDPEPELKAWAELSTRLAEAIRISAKLTAEFEQRTGHIKHVRCTRTRK